MALPPGWLAPLVRSLRQWGPTAAVTPAIVPLDEASWTPRGPTGQVVTIDDRFDFVWVREETIYPTGLVGTVLGCCVAMGREWYHQVGGFDLGLHRWGCEFVDLIMKVYATGGACYHEPSSCVGHLFRTAFPYAMSCRDVTYNKLRTGYVHLSDRRFRRLLDRLADEPGFAEAMAEFHNDLSEIDQLRQARHASNQRDAEWFVRMFLPGLCEGPESLAISAGDSSCTLGPCGPTWNKTPAPPDHFPW
jgi:hypothetical protein